MRGGDPALSGRIFICIYALIVLYLLLEVQRIFEVDEGVELIIIHNVIYIIPLHVICSILCEQM